MDEMTKRKLMKMWDLNERIIAKVCEIKGLTIRDGNLYDKDGNAMLYHDCECVAFADNPIRVSANESVIAVYLWGNYCLELNTHDGNINDYGESYSWDEFSINVLERVLEVLNKISE